FQGDGKKLINISESAGPVFKKDLTARGLAVGDYDNDGRPDVLIANNGKPPLLLHNVSGKGNHWLGLKLHGAKCNRDAIGAKITWSAGGVTRSRLKTGGGSYLSYHDPREVLGIGKAAKVDWVEIKWPAPSGKVERYSQLPVDKYVAVTEGKGI